MEGGGFSGEVVAWQGEFNVEQDVVGSGEDFERGDEASEAVPACVVFGAVGVEQFFRLAGLGFEDGERGAVGELGLLVVGVGHELTCDMDEGSDTGLEEFGELLVGDPAGWWRRVGWVHGRWGCWTLRGTGWGVERQAQSAERRAGSGKREGGRAERRAQRAEG
ncbi:MAG: hypothetical protein RI897_4403 [Verrucomicrobiota bacterium]